jgi:hypothetical protein
MAVDATMPLSKQYLERTFRFGEGRHDSRSEYPEGYPICCGSNRRRF